MEKILILINPGSGKSFPEEIENEIKDRLSRRRIDYRILELGADVGIQEVHSEIASYKPTIAVAAGGDGTVSLVAGAIRGKEIRLGILPMGSSNALAYQFGIPDDRSEALDIIMEGRSRKVDMILINEQHLCLHMCDLGMNARVIRRYEQENIRGLYGYARQYLREMGNREKFRVRVSDCSGKQLSAGAVMVVLANGPHYGTGAKVAPEGKPDDGEFEVVAIRSYPFWFLFYMLLSIFTGKVDVRRYSRIVRCREARIRVTPSQEMQVDGEVFGEHSEITARILPGELKIISPDPFSEDPSHR